MLKDTNINVRVNSTTKKETEAILNELGLSLSSAIDLYLAQIIKTRGIPFDIKLPNKENAEKILQIGKIINSLGGASTTPELNKIIELYAQNDISYDVAVYAIKEIFNK
ncbi:MAG: RelB antitoxin [Tenericutes bacterium ADurb.Bin087]|nr:MAG: RelB antitoxin [Tenericutes bacterium ADurb.Bin087]